MFYIYAVYNKEQNKIYIGQTENIRKRIIHHNQKTFTKSYTAKIGGYWELIYSEEFNTREDALKREKQLKSYRGREFIKKHIPQ